MIENLKKGDKVLFVSKPYNTDEISWHDSLNKFLGKIVTISGIYDVFDHTDYHVCEVNEVNIVNTDLV